MLRHLGRNRKEKMMSIAPVAQRDGGRINTKQSAAVPIVCVPVSHSGKDMKRAASCSVTCHRM